MVTFGAIVTLITLSRKGSEYTGVVVASSVSTYLDVTQAATAATGPTPDSIEADPEFTAQAAKVLAAIHEGAEVITELHERSGLETAQILAALAWLSQAGLVELDDQEGTLHARLTEPAKAALTST